MAQSPLPGSGDKTNAEDGISARFKEIVLDAHAFKIGTCAGSPPASLQPGCADYIPPVTRVSPVPETAMHYGLPFRAGLMAGH